MAREVVISALVTDADGEEKHALIVGTIFQFLAVHRGFGKKKHRWVITHVRTGKAIGNYLNHFPTRRKAMEVAEFLDGPEWDFMRKTVPKAAIDKWRAACDKFGFPYPPTE